MKYELKNGGVSLFIGEYTVNLYWPSLHTRIGHDKLDPNEYHSYSRTQTGFSANTQILYTRPYDGWSWHKSLVVRILGFGVGVAHQHIDNPNMKNKEPKV